MIKFTLFARSGLNLFFGAVFFGLIGAEFLGGLKPAGVYAVLDGFTGLIMAIALAQKTNGTWSTVVCTLDALIRIFIGSIVLRYPGLQETIFGSTFFFATLIGSCLVLGMIGIIGTFFIVLGNSKQPKKNKRLAWPVLMTSISTTLLGVGFYFRFLEENQSNLLGIYSVFVSMVYLIAGLQSAASIMRNSNKSLIE